MKSEESPPPAPAPRSFAERLFTPENVRILQSLGIGIIFISGIALVRNQMWSGATNLQRLGILIGGTAICYAIGTLLYRWTALKITGLGFLILGHLAMILDAYAALILPDTGQRLYPYSGASLWACTFALFTVTAFVHSRILKEPLFNAFTLFGGVAAWISASLWADISPPLIPAALLPALLIARGLAAWMQHSRQQSETETQPVQRWSLEWWLHSAWLAGSNLLAAVLIGAAVYASYIVRTPGAQNELAAKFIYHAAALAALGLALIAQRRAALGTSYIGSLLLLLIAPLAAYAFDWPLGRMPLALSAPGAALLILALVTRYILGRDESARSRCDAVMDWGLGAATLGGLWALGFHVIGGNSLVLWTALSSTLAAVTYALARRSAMGAWLATAAAGLLGLAITQRIGLSYDSVPLALLGSSALLRILWHAASRRESLTETAKHGGQSTDVLALCAGLRLLTLSAPLFGFGVPSDLSLAYSWAAASAYVMLSSIINQGKSRRSIALGLLAPALASAMYAKGAAFGTPAPFIAALAVAFFGLELWWNRAGDKHKALLPGAAISAFHALCLATFQYGTGHNASAAIAFAVLASIGVAAAVHLRIFAMASAAWYEFLSLGLVSLSWLNVCELMGVSSATWPPALILLAALIVLLSLAAESLAGLLIHALHEGDAPVSTSESQRPFHIAGEAVALLLALFALERLIFFSAYQPHEWFITNGSIAALLTAFLAVRPAFSRKEETPTSTGVMMSFSAGLLASIFFATAAFNTVGTHFWLWTCPSSVRHTCELFFAATLGLSIAAGVWMRRAFSPITAVLAALGLVGCAYGAFDLPVESFGLACVILAAIVNGVSLRMRKVAELLRSGLLFATEFSSGALALFAMYHMSFGLADWKPGPLHAYSVAAWLIIAAITTLGAPAGLSAWRAFIASIATGFASCHLMRWMGSSFNQFGPALSGCALTVLAVREMLFFAPRDPEDSQAPISAAGAGLRRNVAASAPQAGLLLASLPLAAAGLALGAWGWHHEWLWCATLAETGLYFAALAVTLRRTDSVNTGLVLGCELAAWLSLAFAVIAAAHASMLPLPGASWALLGAVSMALGMAAESVAGALLGSERHSRTPTPFLESRHFAAIGMSLFALMQILDSGSPLATAHIDATWRTLFGIAILAVYLSMSAWSNFAPWRELGRVISAFGAYIVLIPAAYLCFLKAHSTGSSWGALWFMLLAPVMYGAAYGLEYEKQQVQAAMAQFGILVVNIGALLLAFFGNREHLAAVPAVTFALIAAQACLVRRMNPLSELTWAACLASTGSVFYGLRALLHVPLMGGVEPCAFEMPALAAWATALVSLGGAFRIDEDETGVSRPGYFGGWLAVAAVADTTLSLLVRGSEMRSMPILHHVRIDALIMCLLFGAATAISARRWLRFELGKYLAPAATMAGYVLFVLKEPVTNWEWITMPVALFLFLWARQQASDADHSEPEVSILLGLASSFALIPSFVQAMPYDNSALWHAAVLLAAGFAMVLGAMFARRKIPLLAGSGGMLLLTLVKTLQWAAHRELFLPLVGIAVGFAILAMGSVFEARMNRLIRETLGRAKAEARMFWVSWN